MDIRQCTQHGAKGLLQIVEPGAVSSMNEGRPGAGSWAWAREETAEQSGLYPQVRSPGRGWIEVDWLRLSPTGLQ